MGKARKAGIQCNIRCHIVCNKICNIYCYTYFTFSVTLYVTREQNDPPFLYRQYNIMFNVVFVILPEMSISVKVAFTEKIDF